MRILLMIFATAMFFALPSRAEDSGVPAPAAAAAPSPDTDSPANFSLKDLRDRQVEVDDNDATARRDSPVPADSDPDACTARDVASTMKMPENLPEDENAANGAGGGFDYTGTRNAKKTSGRITCQAAYNKMTDACYQGMPCAGCEDAVKKFSDACGYVQRFDPTDGASGPMPEMSGNREQPVNKIPYAGTK